MTKKTGQRHPLARSIEVQRGVSSEKHSGVNDVDVGSAQPVKLKPPFAGGGARPLPERVLRVAGSLAGDYAVRPTHVLSDWVRELRAHLGYLSSGVAARRACRRG